MPRSPARRLADIARAIADIHAFVDGLDQAAFLASPRQDRKTFKAVSASLMEIGEAVKALPEEVTGRYPQIPWRAIAGLRDRVAHEYFQVDVEVIWTTLERGELDALLEVVEAEIARRPQQDPQDR
ncbi:HepT-like ribonuclease domain-containing protein [Breoghania sp. JC706]|uniref:HepT-like ribonuclease domain-containing protein n=1 Tax=Breoghania sp. JC706 TaxID=3117732 RepID=UPI003009E609